MYARMYYHAHIYTQTTTSSKELDRWFKIKHCSAVPATVHSFASRRCTTPEHRISGCSEHYTTKPLKLFRLIVLKLIYIYIYNIIYIQYIKSYSYRYTHVYIYISSMKGHSWTTHRWILKKSKKKRTTHRWIIKMSKKVHLAALSSLTIRISLGCEQPRWENTTSVFSRCDGSSHRLAARPHTSI